MNQRLFNVNPSYDFVNCGIDRRWIQALNVDDVTLPAFSIVEFYPLPGRVRRSGEDGADNWVPHIRQATHWRRPSRTGSGSKRRARGAVGLMSPYLFAVTGEQTIRPGKTGSITLEYPAQVLHDGSKDALASGEVCGPLDAKFEIWSVDEGGEGFRCIGHDPTNPVFGDRNKKRRSVPSAGSSGRGFDGIHTVWIVPDPHPQTPIWIDTEADEQEVEPYAPVALALLNGNDRENENSRLRVQDGALEIKPGVWEVQVSASVRSDDAPDNTTLRMQLELDGSGTGHKARRVQTVDSDTYDYKGTRSEENMAWGGFIRHEPPDDLDNAEDPDPWAKLTATNISAHNINVACFLLRAHMVELL